MFKNKILNKFNKNLKNININKYENNKDSYKKKKILNCWGLLISDLINQGNQFFSLTINPIYYTDFNFKSSEERMGFEYDLINHISQNFPTISFMWFIYEKNKNEVLHIHAVICIKNFIDYNYTLKNNLIELLIKSIRVGGITCKIVNKYDDFNFFNYKYSDNEYENGWTVEFYGDLNCSYDLGFDVKLESLLYFKDIKNWIIYMHKDIKLWDSNLISNIYYSDSNFKNKFIEDLGLLDEYNYYGDGLINLCSIYWLKNFKKRDCFKFFIGIKIVNNKIDQSTLIHLLQYYLILNKYYIYNGNIYEKINESKISYKLVGTLIEILYDNFQENVVFYYITNFEMYFKGFDFNYLLINYFIKTKNIIESIKDISTQKIEPDFGLIEFTDGIYSIKYDRFFPNENNYLFNNKTSTIKYYNKSYSWTRRNKPNNWIFGLKNALGIINKEITNEDFIRLCLHMINPIHKDLFNKKSTLFVYGQSNTGKTTLLANVLSDYYGSSNTGSVVSAKNFRWQDLIGKKLGIIDEGRYNCSMSTDLLKITGQERIIVEKKYSKEHIVIDPIPLIILTNILFEDKNKDIDQALKNRLYIIEFINIISKENINNSKIFKSKLKEEEPNIIVYCNKLLFKLKNDNLKKIGFKISNEKLIKIIENNK